MAEKPKKADADDLLKRGREAFTRCEDAENDNRTTGEEDLRFAKLGEQWPADAIKMRGPGRPTLTINKMTAFIRQVVNDARQNKPSIKVHPVDSGADPETAEVLNGLIRNIEYSSNADVAYDTATECAVTTGFGYIRVGLDYAFEDSFEMDITIERVINPFSVYGDPNSTAADSSDWNVAFVVDKLTKEEFEAKYGDKAQVDWDDTTWNGIDSTWRSDNLILIAEWWERTEYEKPIYKLSNGTVVGPEELEDPDIATQIEAGMLQVVNQRTTKCHKVVQRIMTGAEVLEEREWPGRYIPIVPVYGDEFSVKGKRYFRSLINPAKDAQRMFNYWRTTGTELVALAPRVPFIGKKGAFATDVDKWNTINNTNHPFVEYDGADPPQRQPLDMGVAAGALQEALNASDDMKAVIGMYDASLGARSNETSGKAILARQREGDIATFHFMDNMARAIRHVGRILIDLIPKVYDTARVVRTIGEDGTQKPAKINQETPKLDKKGQPMSEPVIGPDGKPQMGQDGNPLTQPIMAMHNLTAGKYDLVVSSGPSFTTRREEAVVAMTDMMQAMPEAGPVLAKHVVKNMDFPGADDIGEELDRIAAGQLPPEVQKGIEQGKQKIAQLTEEVQQLKADQQTEMVKAENDKQLAIIKLNNEREIAEIEIAGAQRIAEIKLQGELRIKAMTATAQADNMARTTEFKAENAAEQTKIKAKQQNSRQPA
jgi:hypothetical protein